MKITLKSEVNWSGESVMTARAGIHTILLDEPAAAGGTDKGPSPVQYLLASLGGCIIAIGRMVAGEMGLEIEGIRCRVEGDLDRVGLQGKDPNVRPGLLAIRIKIDAKTQEPAEKMKRWLEQIEKRCPVKDCLSRPVPIELAFE